MTPRDLQCLLHRTPRCFSESLVIELTLIHTNTPDGTQRHERNRLLSVLHGSLSKSTPAPD
jgi:hypothetical protein